MKKKKLSASTELRCGAVAIDLLQRKVLMNKKELLLTKKEFDVVTYLVKNAGKVVTRETLLSQVWGSSVVVVDRTIDVHIRKIREKFGAHAHYITTIKGIGYKMEEH